MLTLKLNGSPFPGSLVSNVVYRVDTFVDDRRVVPTEWAVSDVSGVLYSGNGTEIEFTPLVSGPHTVYAKSTGSDGYPQEALIGFNVTAYAAPAEISILWNYARLSPGRTLRGSILVADPQGKPPRSIGWTLYRNNVAVASDGTGPFVEYPAAPDGLYRLRALAVDSQGQTVVGESTVAVTANYEQQGVNPIGEADPTLVEIGTVYTDIVAGSGGGSSELPYQLASLVQTLHLPAGTTHLLYALAEDAVVDDEVVVRAKTGNWTLAGYPGGLHDEQVGYDYQAARIIPAPADLKLQITLDAFNVHSVSYAAFSFRVKVVCYRQSDPVYRYVPCANSTHPGGAGLRERRWVVLPTALDIVPDADSTLDRNNTGGSARPYTTTEATTVPYVEASPDGSPYPVNAATGYSFTDANWFASYETNGLPDIKAKVVCGLEGGVRPSIMTLLQSGNPVYVERVKRIGGNLTVYMTGGAVSAGSTVNVTVETGLGVETFEVPVTEDIYNAAENVFQKVGAISVDLSDYQFGRNGIVFRIEVVEPFSSGGTLASVPAGGPDEIFTTTRADTVVFDGACYTGRELVGVFDGTLAVATTAGTGCGSPECGPVGLYCYTSVCSGTEDKDIFPQPLGFPAPYVARAETPFQCYGNPVFLMYGTGTFDVPALVSYQNGSYCGDAYAYDRCSANGDSIVVVYPCDTSPHDFIEKGSQCYTLGGTLNGTAGDYVYTVSEVNPVASCADIACTGSDAAGQSYAYFDVETGIQVNVAFEGLDSGIPSFGVASETVDYGTPDLSGSKTFRIVRPRELLIPSVPTSGRVRFQTNLGIQKSIVTVRNGNETKVSIGSTSTSRVVELTEGDSVYIEIATPFGAVNPRVLNRTAVVSWSAQITLPRVYDTFTHAGTQTSAIVAVGFCGLSNRSEYAFYGTLPFDADVSGLPNMTGILTVSDGTQELALVRPRTPGASPYPLPSSVQWYSGQSLTGPLTFNFYSYLADYGAHGEMDLWLEADGTYPAYFKMSEYVVLESGTDSYPAVSAVGDTSRNSLRVTTQPKVPFIELPSVYVGPDGRLITVATDSAAVKYQGVTYSRVSVDPGISYDVLTANEVLILGDNWLTADGTLPWLTVDGEPWLYV